MNPIDTSLIERIYSPAAGWVQHRLDIGQWRLSIECLNGSIAFYLAALALTIAGKGIGDGIFVDLLAALFWLGILEAGRRTAQRQAGSSIGSQTARMREWLLRTILVLSLPLSLFHARELDNLFYSVSLIFLISHLYFKACDTPPPRRQSKLARAGA